MTILSREYFSSLNAMVDYINKIQNDGIQCIDGFTWPVTLITQAFNNGLRYVCTGSGSGLINEPFTAWEFDYTAK